MPSSLNVLRARILFAFSQENTKALTITPAITAIAKSNNTVNNDTNSNTNKSVLGILLKILKLFQANVPILNLTELNRIIMARNTIVIPNFEGKNGHPIKMNVDFWQKLVSLDISEENSRLDLQIKKINPEEISIVKVKDASIIKNLNTKTAWLDFLNECD